MDHCTSFFCDFAGEHPALLHLFSIIQSCDPWLPRRKMPFFHKIDPCPENFGIMEKIQREICHFPQGSLDRTLTKE